MVTICSATTSGSTGVCPASVLGPRLVLVTEPRGRVSMGAEERPGLRLQGLDGKNMRAHTQPPGVACFGCSRSLGQAGLGCRRGSGENVLEAAANGQGKVSSGRGSHTAVRDAALG